MDGCIYRTKDGECDLYAEGGKYKAFCEMDGCKGRKMSNGDRIRQMSDEEFAEWLAWYETKCYKRIAPLAGCDTEQFAKEILEWLKQEAKDDV